MTQKQTAAQPVAQPTDCGPFELAAIQRTKARSRYLRTAIRELFIVGQEYLDIGGRWVLTKAGAETLLGCFELVALHSITDRFDLDEDALVAVDGELKARHGYYEARSQCTLQSHTGIVVARASGSANSNESWATGLSVWDAKNPVLKMAEKRALVAAVLVAVGGSAAFTQDLEDFKSQSASAVVPVAVGPPADPVVPAVAAATSSDAKLPVAAKSLAPAPVAAPAAGPASTPAARPQAGKPAVMMPPAQGQRPWRQPPAQTAEGLEQQLRQLQAELSRRDPKAAELIRGQTMTDEQRHKALAAELRRVEQAASRNTQTASDKASKPNTMRDDYKWDEQ